MPQIQLLNGKKIPFTKSISGLELTKKISKSLEKAALIMEVDGQLKDLTYEITTDSKVRVITSKDMLITEDIVNKIQWKWANCNNNIEKELLKTHIINNLNKPFEKGLF